MQAAIGVLTIGSAGVAHAGLAGAKDILFFGNSFTQSGGGVERVVSELAVGAGHAEPSVFALAVGGRSLAWHLAYGTPVIEQFAPDDGVWDHVVMQEFSTRPTDHPELGDPQLFYDSAAGLASAVRAHSPGVGAVLFETWARGPGHGVYPDDWASPAAMQGELAHHYGVAAGQIGADVARVGTAFGEAGFDLSLYGSDRWHASNHGALLAGMMIYAAVYDDATLTDIDLSAAADLLGVPMADAVALAEVAERVVPGPGGLAVGAVLGACVVTRRRGRAPRVV